MKSNLINLLARVVICLLPTAIWLVEVGLQMEQERKG